MTVISPMGAGNGMIYVDPNGISHITQPGTSATVLTSTGATSEPTWQVAPQAGLPTTIRTASTTVGAFSNNICDNGVSITLTLPVTPIDGTYVSVYMANSTVVIQASPGQKIVSPGAASSVAGTLTSITQYSSVFFCYYSVGEIWMTTPKGNFMVA